MKVSNYYKKYLILFSFTTLALRVTSSITAPPPFIQSYVYVSGLGISYLVDQFSKQLTDVIIEQDAQLADQLGAGDKDIAKQKSNLAKSINTAIRGASKDYWEQFLKSNPLSSSDISILGEAFEAGLKLPFVLDLLLAAAGLAQSTGQSLSELTKQMGYASLDAARMSLNGLLQAVRGLQPSYRYDLGYPIKSYHTTALTCGKNDPYCLALENAQQQAPQDLISDPNVLALELFRLSMQGASIAVGVLIATIAFEIGSQIAPLIATGLNDFNLNFQIKKAMSKLFQRYIEMGIIDQLNEWFIQLAKSKHIVSPETQITAQDLSLAIKVGGKGSVSLVSGSWAMQFKFLRNLFNF